MQNQNQQREPTIYLKEYVCYNFQIPDNDKVGWTQQVNFEYCHDKHNQLPLVCQDNFSINPLLYFTQSKQEQSNKILYLREAKQQSWGAIKMNELPLYIKITDNHAFLIGHKQLFIVSLQNSGHIVKLPLQSGNIIDIKLCFTEKGESGIYIIYYQQRFGYFGRSYSKSMSFSYWSRIKSFLSISLKKFEQYKYFEVVLPNILAIGINQSELFLYDLNSMKKTSVCLTLQSENQIQKMKMRWKLSQPNEGYTDALDIFLCDGSWIRLYSVQIARNNFFIEINHQKVENRVQLDRIIGGDVIDWDKSKIIKSSFQILVEGVIRDFKISQTNLIYYFSENVQNSIPKIVIVKLQQKESKVGTIINIQTNIYHQYLYKYLFSEGKFFQLSEDRQIYQSCKRLQGKRQLKINDFQRKIFKDNTQFIQYIILQSQFYCVRSGSLTKYLPIEKIQYIIEQSLTQNRIIQEFNAYNTQKMVLYQQIYKKYLLYNVDDEELINHYKSIMSFLKNTIQHQTTAANKQQRETFKQKLLSNLVKDKLRYFSIFIKFMLQVMKFDQKSIKNKIIYSILFFLQQNILLAEKINFLKKDFVDILIQSVTNQFSDTFQITEKMIFQKIYQNILPDCFIKLDQTSINTNYFLDILINLMLKNQESDATLLHLQSQLRKFTSEINKMDNKYFLSLITRNNSIFLAFMLSHPPKEQLISILQFAYKQPTFENMVFGLRKIKHLIPNQLQVLLQFQFNNRKSISNNRQSFQSINKYFNEPSIIGHFIQKPCKSQIIEEIALYNSKESFQNNKKRLLDYCKPFKAVSIFQFGQLHKRISQLSHQQLHIDILNRDFQHILQWEEIRLKQYSSLFNEQLKCLQSVQDSQISRLKAFLKIVLDQIDYSFSIYCKYYSIFYKQQNGLLHTKNNERHADPSFFYQQQIMSNGKLSKPIKIFIFICSHISIAILRILISQQDAVLQMRKNKLFTQPQKDISFIIVRDLLRKQKIISDEVEILNFLLIKEGERYMASMFRQFLPSDLQKITIYLSQKRDHNSLYGVVNQIIHPTEKKISKYRNPFALN